MTATLLPVTVPDIGDFADVPVIEVLVSVGDTVSPEDPLVTLESDKATMDVPAPAAGTVTEIAVKVGDHVSEGSLLLSLSAGETDATPPPSAADGTAPTAPRRATAGRRRRCGLPSRSRRTHRATAPDRSMPVRPCAASRASSAYRSPM